MEKYTKDTIGMGDWELLYYSQSVNPRLTGGCDFHSQCHWFHFAGSSLFPMAGERD
jgi:hypothetical protein